MDGWMGGKKGKLVVNCQRGVEVGGAATPRPRKKEESMQRGKKRCMGAQRATGFNETR